MKTCQFLLILLLAAALVGCGSTKDKAVNKNADKPKAAEKAKG